MDKYCVKDQRAEKKSWRKDPQFYFAGSDPKPGTFSCSPAWFQVGHEVNLNN